MILTIVIIGFAAVTFVLWKLYKHTENLLKCAMESLKDRVDEAEFRMVELEDMIREVGR